MADVSMAPPWRAVLSTASRVPGASHAPGDDIRPGGRLPQAVIRGTAPVVSRTEHFAVAPCSGAARRNSGEKRGNGRFPTTPGVACALRFQNRPERGSDQMKAAVLERYDEKLSGDAFVRYMDVPDPKIAAATDVIVRIGGAGVCRTDLHIVEGIWRGKVEVALPYIMGHENAGWVEEVGSAVEGVRVGDAVICHPLVTSGHCLACRRGDDMHATDSKFPGINANGGYAQYLLTGERSLIKLPKSLAPKDVAPYTDAGLTAYRAAKKASRHLLPGQTVAVIGGRRPRPHRHPGAGRAVRRRDHRDRSLGDRAAAGRRVRRAPQGARRRPRGRGGAGADRRPRRGGGDRLRGRGRRGGARPRDDPKRRHVLHRRLRREDRDADHRHGHIREDHRRQSRRHLPGAGRADGARRPRPRAPRDQGIPAGAGRIRRCSTCTTARSAAARC